MSAKADRDEITGLELQLATTDALNVDLRAQLETVTRERDKALTDLGALGECLAGQLAKAQAEAAAMRNAIDGMQRLLLPREGVDLWTMHPDIRDPLLAKIRGGR